MKLTIHNLSKGYNGHEILKNINLEITASSIGIIGESGCGMSTLLRQLAGIETPDQGEIWVNGISPIQDRKAFQENIGYVFQKHNLFPHLTIRENILLILEKIKKIHPGEAAIIADQVLEKLHIKEIEHKRPNRISGGQAQRASIARALATNPQLVFLDEPTAALDPILTDEVLHAVNELKQDGRDFLFVTHEIDFLKQFADFIIFLKDGTVCEYGSAECLEQPKTRELGEFLKINREVL